MAISSMKFFRLSELNKKSNSIFGLNYAHCTLHTFNWLVYTTTSRYLFKLLDFMCLHLFYRNFYSQVVGNYSPENLKTLTPPPGCRDTKNRKNYCEKTGVRR